jgi:hypothetical protein
LQFALRDMPVSPLLKKIIQDNEANTNSPLVGKDGKAIETIPVHKGFYGKWNQLIVLM